ncbi:MAG: porin family protein [Armatimonadota bacterium]
MRYPFFSPAAACLAAVVALLFVPSSAQALPAFARRAGVSCDSCHWHQNALTAMGKEYLRRGLRVADEDASAKKADTNLSHYASVLLTPSLSLAEGDNARFLAGDAMLWLAGPVDNKFSAVAEIEFKIDDAEVEVEEIYAHYVSNPSSNYLSARVGQFQPFVLLTQVSGPPRITISRPEAISGKATNGNGFRPRSRLRGAEFGMVHGPASAYVGIGNGPQQNEDDNHMDFYASAEYEIGDQGSSIGAWGYWGEAVLGGGERDTFNRYCVIGNLTTQRMRLVGAYLLGSNEDALGAELDNDGAFVEAAFSLSPGVVLYGRWDQFNRELSGGGERSTDGPTVGISWLPTELTRIAIEAQSLDTDGTTANTLTAELQIAF